MLCRRKSRRIVNENREKTEGTLGNVISPAIIVTRTDESGYLDKMDRKFANFIVQHSGISKLRRMVIFGLTRFVLNNPNLLLDSIIIRFTT